MWQELCAVRSLCATAWLFVLFCSGLANAQVGTAEVTGGSIRGIVINSVASFKGIPFAAPPVGALRWKDPQPVERWAHVRDATGFQHPCMQQWADHPNRPSEDCLYLNVWTAAVSAKERRPVMVWIHGGGFGGGMSWEALSDGTVLAKEGVVVVTIAYRLNVFGFLAHPELSRESGHGSGNYGLQDIVASLQWVQKNIEQFGGDPSRVTIFGGSAGGVAVNLLATSPLAKGLFSRVIAQGGADFFPLSQVEGRPGTIWPLKTAESAGEKFFDSLAVSNLEAARRLDSDVVLQAHENWHSVPVIVDGEIIRDSSSGMFAKGQFNDTPILVGFTSDEAGDPPPETTAESIRSIFRSAPCKEHHAAIEAVYPVDTDEAAFGSLRRLQRDWGTGLHAWSWARLQSTKGRNDAYLYFFDVHPPEQVHGATHASEYQYVFGNLMGIPDAQQERTSKIIRRYWVNFATHGDPNGRGLPEWKKFDTKSEQALILNDSPVSRPLPNGRELQVLEAVAACWFGTPLFR
jgi:para-nitrobenzyl esterase